MKHRFAPLANAFALTIALAVVGCSTPTVWPDGTGTETLDAGEDAPLFSDVTFGQDTLVADLFAPKDQPEWDFRFDFSSDTDAVVYLCGGKACPGDSCMKNDDCESSLCVFHLGDKVCTNTCVEECPIGFDCMKLQTGPDQEFACLSRHSHLCLPCETDADCSTEGVKTRCLVYGEVGRFCGSTCSVDGDCPQGYGCQAAEGLDGVKTSQCVYLDGPCPCSKSAVALALSTWCRRTNAVGQCEGQRVCLPEGLGECSALIPAGESCDGVDNDCNGTIDDGACDDENPCTADLCTPGQGCSYTNLDGDACDDLDACSASDVCMGGACKGVDLVCSDGNPCTNDLCDHVTGCLYPFNELPCTDGEACTFGDNCYLGKCHSGPISDCEDNNPCTDDYCDDVTMCKHLPNAAECTDFNECTVGDHCENGFCIPMSSVECDDNNPCTTDACDQQGGCLYTNNSESCSDNDFCTENDYCLGGLCQSGTKRDCNDNNVCTDDICQASVGCLHPYNDVGCSDQDPCTVVDVCKQGQCVGTGALSCDDGKVCTTDNCVPKVGCVLTNNNNPCSDNSECTLGDTCAGGVCVPGTELNCNDNNVCTSDYCLPATGCGHDSLSGNNCSDNSLCTIGDKCQAGQCAPGPIDPCDDSKQCTLDSCEAATGCKHVNITGNCNDGNACTLGDVCQADLCKSGTQAPNCDDNNECTTDSCDPASGCKNVKLTGSSCNDLNACTDGDYCSAGTCVAGFAKNCADTNVCTDDKCDVLTGCYYLANTATCDDGNKCTDGDKCSGKACLPGVDLVCNDSNVCTTDSCVPASGCLYTKLTGTNCSDNNDCTLNDKCSNGVCGAGTSLDCNDNNVCTLDGCAPSGGCTHTPAAGSCNDGNACTENDTCSAGECISGPALVCNDNKACTDDTCVPATGCKYTNDDANTCTDNNLCTVNDRCSAGACINDGAPNCADTNQCTDDVCVPASGCTHPNTLNGTGCNDNNKCTTVDTCQSGNCTGSSPLTCNDNNACTDDVCVPATGCTYTNDNTNTCNDGNFCTTGDHCVGGACVKTSDTVCPAQICKSAACNSATGCVYTAITPCCGNNIKETAGTAKEECDDGCALGDVTICDAADNGDGCEQDCTVTCFFKDIAYLYCSGSCSYAGDTGCDQLDADLFCRLKTCNINASAASWQLITISGSSPDVPGIACSAGGKGTNKGTQPAYGVYVNVWYVDKFKTSYPTGNTAIGNVVCNDP